MSEVPNLKIRVLDNPAAVADFWAWLTRPGRQYVACDTETTGLDWWSPTFRIRLAQFGDVEGGWAIPFEGWPELVKGALEWCSKARVKIVFHNASYDAQAFRSAGIELDWSVVEDTMVWAAVSGYADQDRKLKNLSMREFGPWAGAGERVLKHGMKEQGWSWADVPLGWKPYPLYGVVDTCVTAALWEQWADRRKRWAGDHALEIATIRITNGMEWRGIPTDGDYLYDQIDAHQAREDEIRAQLATFGITNPAQNGQLEVALRSAGVELNARTEKGKVQLNDDVLKLIDHPAAQLTRQYRQVNRWRVAYLEAIFKASGSALGRGVMHPGIKSLEARTGRMSVERPPLQQLPSDDPVVRRAIIGRDDDEVVVSSDFGQIELRLWATIFNDEAMIAALKTADATGGDFFVELGKTVYGEPDFVKKDHRRTLLKSTTYAKLFGGGIEVAAGTAGVGVYDLVPTWKSLEQAYPSLKTLGMDEVKTRKTDDGGTEHVIASPFGREFKVKDPAERRKLGNYVCQGTAAIVLKKALVALDAAGFGDAMMLPVHDEVLFSLPKTDAPDAMVEIAETMNSILPEEVLGLAVRAEPGMGANWAEAK